MRDPSSKLMPLGMVGSTMFGRFPKISIEQTINMMIADNWLIPFPGYLKRCLKQTLLGRGVFNSSRGNFLIVVSDSNVFLIDNAFTPQVVGSLKTSSGDVFIDEDHAQNIVICDQTNTLYNYNWGSDVFSSAALDFTPGYITYQDGLFIAPDINNPQWRLSEYNKPLSWPTDKRSVGVFQTKGDNPVACIRFPGGGNQLLVMGKIVTEVWMNVGLQLFRYQRASSANIDYGCLNPSTIAYGENFIVWLGSNEKSGPTILISRGGNNVIPIATDGINYKLSQVKNFEYAYGGLVKIDGRLIYILTFPDQLDNFTLAYDFSIEKFITLTDEYLNYFIAKRFAYFNNSVYFVSFKDGSLYELNSKYMTYNGAEIPRIRICPTLRFPDTSAFRVNNIIFPIEQGHNYLDARVDMSVSIDGGVSFGNSFGLPLNPLGVRKNQMIFWYNGICNEFIPQFKFWGMERFVVGEGQINIYK